MSPPCQSNGKPGYAVWYRWDSTQMVEFEHPSIGNREDVRWLVKADFYDLLGDTGVPRVAVLSASLNQINTGGVWGYMMHNMLPDNSLYFSSIYFKDGKRVFVGRGMSNDIYDSRQDPLLPDEAVHIRVPRTIDFKPLPIENGTQYKPLTISFDPQTQTYKVCFTYYDSSYKTKKSIAVSSTRDFIGLWPVGIDGGINIDRLIAVVPSAEYVRGNLPPDAHLPRSRSLFLFGDF
ncbi:hypothetical protein A2276_06665 [candidate division WOR-1 bacterium RIFOXYA12_FULL_43_27]|nr:MAG: hypothetical protein A2276_06665 [candidate division WOR-1 bacterium RIFOXYA12_FULL_43_27]OGC20328.1 MAG: hypothetical protein A2292_04665 [candidate division WOR-1 bacterium RIFOXYB2_FULL_46_45]